MAVTDTQPVSTENLSGAIDAIKSPGALLDVMYPIGSIYLSTASSDPATLFGGTWQRIKDRFLLAAGDAYSAGGTGGEAIHKLTTSEMPAHNHNASLTVAFDTASSSSNMNKAVGSDYNYSTRTLSLSTDSVGGGAGHNNMPPYIVVNAWKRTA